MRLNKWADVGDLFFPAAIAWSMRLIAYGYNAWITPSNLEGKFDVWYEHPRGIIESPPVGWQLQFHSSPDGFVSPTWTVNISADCAIPKGMIR